MTDAVVDANDQLRESDHSDQTEVKRQDVSSQLLFWNRVILTVMIVSALAFLVALYVYLFPRFGGDGMAASSLTSGLFGATAPSSSSLFGSSAGNTESSSSSLFGSSAGNTEPSSSSLFGSSVENTETAAPTSNLFGSSAPSAESAAPSASWMDSLSMRQQQSANDTTESSQPQAYEAEQPPPN